MPFGGAEFIPRREKGAPRRGPDNAVTVLIVMLAFVLLAMPITLGGLVDLVRYLRG